MDELKVKYYFGGDDSLPFQLADPNDTVDRLFEYALPRLIEWLGGRIVINSDIDPFVDIEGPVFIGPNTHIQSGVQITGPVYIGAGVHIHHGAQLRSGTIIGDLSVVGHSAELKASVCMAGSKMQSGVFVGDSFLGLGARLGSGTILSNRRFDQGTISMGHGNVKLPTERKFLGAIIGDNSRLGANAVTSPGTLIGPNTWISSLVNVWGFTPRNKQVLLKQDLEIRDKEDFHLSQGIGEYEQ